MSTAYGSAVPHATARHALHGVDVAGTLSSLWLLGGDPTLHRQPGLVRRATRTPEGPVTLTIAWDEDEAIVTGEGPGADWMIARTHRLLGLSDDPSGFEPVEEPLRRLWRSRRNDRLLATGTLWHDLVSVILQQRVTTTDAGEQWGRLLRNYGEPAPGGHELCVPPAPDVLATTSYVDLHRLGIERQRADVLIRSAKVVGRLERRVDEAFSSVEPALRSIRGLGPWTASCLACWTWGEPDAVIVGDDGIPGLVGWVLAREPAADDRRMLELLEPYRPHRQRVVRLIVASGLAPPRRRPRGHRHDIRRR